MLIFQLSQMEEQYQMVYRSEEAFIYKYQPKDPVG